MANTEILLRTILGPIRSDIRPLVFAVSITEDLLFSRHIAMDDIQVTKQIYPEVAKLIHAKSATAARRIERQVRLCWDSIDQQGLAFHYVGRSMPYPPDSKQLLVFLAVYAHLDIPFFTAIEQCPQFLFRPETDIKTPLDTQASATTKEFLRNKPLLVSCVKAFQTPQGLTTFPVCPGCLGMIDREYQSFCDRCGQRLDWKHYHKAQVIYPKQGFVGDLPNLSMMQNKLLTNEHIIPYEQAPEKL